MRVRVWANADAVRLESRPCPVEAGTSALTLVQAFLTRRVGEVTG